MNKELAKSLANFAAHTDNVLTALSESHFWNGAENKSVRLLQAARRDLQERLAAIVELPAPPAPAPSNATPPAA